MNHIINAFKNLPRRGQHNFVKICVPCSIGNRLVIIAEIYFEQTYDTYFPRMGEDVSDFEVGTSMVVNLLVLTKTSGSDCPRCERLCSNGGNATRPTVLWIKNNVSWKNQNSIEAKVLMADSCFLMFSPQKEMGKVQRNFISSIVLHD